MAGNPATIGNLLAQLPIWASAAVIGELLGSELGSRRLSTPTFGSLLGLVLIIAGAKLIFS